MIFLTKKRHVKFKHKLINCRQNEVVKLYTKSCKIAIHVFM